MPKGTRTWTPVDKEAMQVIKELRETDPRKLSLRAIEQETGISHSRVYDLFHERMGSPSLNEFISLCLLFNEKPSVCLDKALQAAGTKQPTREEVEQKDIQQLRDHAARIEKMALHAAEQAAEIRAHPERFTLVAKRGDIEREQEMYNELP